MNKKITKMLKTAIGSAITVEHPLGRKNMAMAAEVAVGDAMRSMQVRGAIEQFKIGSVKIDEEGILKANVHYKPTRPAAAICCKIAMETLINSTFYVMMISHRPHTCTLKDIYEPDYQPLFAVIGDSINNWDLYTESELLAKYGEKMNWKGHIIFGVVFLIFVFVLNLKYKFFHLAVTTELLLYIPLFLFMCLLPDIDHDSSKPRWAIMFFGLIIALVV